MSRRLLLRPWLAAAFGILALVALTTVIMLHQFNETFSRMLRERFTVVLNELAEGIERELVLGLPLNGLPSVAPALSDAMAKHDEIVLIEVFGVDGTVAFSTETSFVGDVILESWQDQLGRDQTGTWYLSEGDRDTLGRSVKGEKGSIEGGIGLTFEAAWADGVRSETWQDLLVISLGIACLALLCAVLMIAWLLAPAGRQLGAAERGVRGLLARWSGGGGAMLSAPASGSGDVAGAGEPAPETARFLASAASAYQVIEMARATVQQLDREA